jgi:NADH-quinone oxidoreductase subunit J
MISLLATTPAIPDLIVFAAGTAMILVGALGVVTSRNPVHAALSLVLTLFGIAVLFIEQQADFLAAVQVVVYAGAIVVLFLFVIMFLGVDRNEDIDAEPLAGQRAMGFIIVVFAVGAIIALGAEAHWVVGPHSVSGLPGGPYQNVSNLGRSVFTTYLFAFEATAALLVIAVVGAVVLARRSGAANAELPEGNPEGEQVAS